MPGVEFLRMALDRVALAYEDYLAMPEDGVRREILDGELAVTATPVPCHQVVVGNLYWLMRGHLQGRPAHCGVRARRRVGRRYSRVTIALARFDACAQRPLEALRPGP